MHTYTFNEHKHNYAVWTAARAVQRGFTTTAKIKAAIKSSSLRNFSEDALTYSEEDFEQFHKECAQQLIKAFEVSGIKDVSYGRAAKIIAIYLKTTIILCNKGECKKSTIIHPPIDNILLTEIATRFKELKNLKNERWTSFDETTYWNLVSKIKSHFNKFDWTLEEYWRPEREKEKPTNYEHL